jgi:tRNA (mo5U34)-methyltransferase
MMYFIEHKYAGDPTNWWIPNRACTEAMLRSSGFEIIAHPEDEVFLCQVRGENGVRSDAGDAAGEGISRAGAA